MKVVHSGSTQEQRRRQASLTHPFLFVTFLFLPLYDLLRSTYYAVFDLCFASHVLYIEDTASTLGRHIVSQVLIPDDFSMAVYQALVYDWSLAADNGHSMTVDDRKNCPAMLTCTCMEMGLSYLVSH